MIKLLNQDYYKIDLNDIINNLEPEEIQVLDYINDLNSYEKRRKTKWNPCQN